MKVSEQWLREWVNPEITTARLAEQLTIAGLEVDSVYPASGPFTDIVVARVNDVQPHPDADKLRICKVDDGSGELQVVCGAPNVGIGMHVPLARVGAVLPDGTRIKNTVLRGVESAGMLCSGQELGMSESATGLLSLPGDAAVGTPLREYLALDDTVIELDLTPNRGDCLSIQGVARDVAAINELSLAGPAIDRIRPGHDETFPVYLDSSGDCPAYCGRLIRDIDPAATTPMWMQEKLRRSGLRSLGPVIDVTNYVMLELGQPMHAFDFDTLQGAIHVRKATAGEELELLDGRNITLESDMLVIADEQQVLALAGIMGGSKTAVSHQTRNIFLESAFFQPLSIIGKARSLGMHTDSSHRFERGVDPELQTLAIERATSLLLQIVGGTPGPVSHVVSEKDMPTRTEVTVRLSRMQALLGIDLSAETVESCFSRLNIQFRGTDGTWHVLPPSYRFDLQIEHDFIEEIARLYGYDNIPSSLPQVPQIMLPDPEGHIDLDTVKQFLAARGWQEAITYSFVDPELQAMLAPDRGAVTLSNPISSEMSVMRTSHWTGLTDALRHNQHRQQTDIRLFETGLNFIAEQGQMESLNQEAAISGITAGRVFPQGWSVPQRNVDFFDVKGDLEALFALTRRAGQLRFVAGENPALHPGQAARILLDDKPAGWLGAMHPGLCQSFEISGPVFLFEIKQSALLEAGPRQFEPISKYPSIRRDIALVLDNRITFAQIHECIRQNQPETIKNISLFDVYTGEGIESGRKSVALGLILQDSSRTLTDEEVEEIVSSVVGVLGDKLGASLRN